MSEETDEHIESGGSKNDQILYSQFIQDGAEFLMNFMVPVQRKTILPTSNHLFGEEMPDWLQSLIKF